MAPRRRRRRRRRQHRKEIPFQPWARAVLADRRLNELEPHTRCKPSGVTRPFLTPYGVEFVELPELQRIYIFDIGGPHTYRTIYMDGRSHPINVAPNYYGHSIGWWEGDTLVVDTVGFNEGFWLDRRGSPHTEQLHTIERLTRTDRRHDAVRSDDRRSRCVHEAVEERLHAPPRRRTSSCSSTSASRRTTPTS